MNNKVDITLFELGPTRSARVRWALLEAGLEFESIQNGIEIFKSEELLNIHPLGKLPAVLIDGQPLFESAAIVTAIADLVPEKGLIANSDSWARHLHNQWICYIINEMDPFLQSSEINTIDFILPVEEHVPKIIPQNHRIFRKAAAPLEQHFSDHQFLVEEHFSVTDIVLAYTLCWAQEQQLLDDFSNLNQYMERMYARKYCTLKQPSS
ncbi:MAG: glutathione S-transferase family protein [Pseudomonadota bacterium]